MHSVYGLWQEHLCRVHGLKFLFIVNLYYAFVKIIKYKHFIDNVSYSFLRYLKVMRNQLVIVSYDRTLTSYDVLMCISRIIREKTREQIGFFLPVRVVDRSVIFHRYVYRGVRFGAVHR